MQVFYLLLFGSFVAIVTCFFTLVVLKKTDKPIIDQDVLLKRLQAKGFTISYGTNIHKVTVYLDYKHILIDYSLIKDDSIDWTPELIKFINTILWQTKKKKLQLQTEVS